MQRTEAAQFRLDDAEAIARELNSVALIAIRSGQETSGLRTNRQGMAATAKRSVVINSGENSSSAIRLATNASPQMTATRTAMPTSTGFIFLFSVF